MGFIIQSGFCVIITASVQDNRTVNAASDTICTLAGRYYFAIFYNLLSTFKLVLLHMMQFSLPLVSQGRYKTICNISY